MRTYKWEIRLVLVLILATGIFARSIAIESPSYLSKLENEVLQELNLARTNPATFARLLEDYRAQFNGKIVKRPGKYDLETTEGTAAVNEAIKYLRKQSALDSLRPSRGMSSAAKDHARDTGPKNMLGHVGSKRSTLETRLNRHGKWGIGIAENISYGMPDGRSVLIQLIVDDGVPSRGHRTNIFEAKYTRVGIGCGPHKKYGTMCVQTFAGDYQEK